jgi:sulfur carrier protein ThiS adenylyltransferase
MRMTTTSGGSPPPALNDRHIRQRDIIPPEKLGQWHALVIGVGAIGRQAALQLASMGIRRLTLVDPDVVSEENLGAQGWRTEDLGRLKVFAAEDGCFDIDRSIVLTSRNGRFDAGLPGRDAFWIPGWKTAVFCCVDSIVSRAEIWKLIRREADFFVDGRMAARTVRILCSTDPGGEEGYDKTLFAAEEALPMSCTAKSTIFTASIAAGLMVNEFGKAVAGLPTSKDILLDLLTLAVSVRD